MKLPAEYTIALVTVGIAIILVFLLFFLKKVLSPSNYRKSRESITAYLYLLPTMMILGLFMFWPIVYSFILSFFRWDFQTQANPVFIGFENYKILFRIKNPVNVSFNEAFFGTLLVVMTFIFFMHLIMDMKKIEKNSYKKLIVLGSVLGLLGIIFNKYIYLTYFIAVLITAIYTVLAAIKFSKPANDKLMQRLIIFFATYAFAVFMGLTEIIKFLNVAKEEVQFLKAIWNTAYYVLLSMPITIFLALIIALLMYQKIVGKTFFRTIYFIPFVTSTVAVSLIWQWIFTDYGLLNHILSSFGISRVLWLKDANFTIPTVAIVSVWKMVGYYAVIFLAGLQNIDRSYYEAAEVDGASAWQKFKHITWPLLSPTTFFILIVSMIGAFKVFDEIFILYSGVPGPHSQSGLTVVYYIYEKFYTEQRMGQASAAAYVLFGIIMIFTFIQLRAGKKRVHYDS
jgi:multiple sugar transport system permease protein